MSAQPLISVNELFVDARDVAARLEAIGTRDDREATVLTLRRAEAEYAELVNRRNALPLLPGNAVALDNLLDSLRARLKFFEKRL